MQFDSEFVFVAIQIRQMGGHEHKTMFIKPSRFQWDKFKDMFHYSVMLGLIPITAIVAYCNIFIGPAQLAEIPKDYEPKHWEYHKVNKLSIYYVLILIHMNFRSTQSLVSSLGTYTLLHNRNTRRCAMLCSKKTKKPSWGS